MSALPLRRALLLIVPFALLLAACDGGEGKPGVPSGLGDTNPGAGEAPAAVEPASHCTTDQLVAPCQGGADDSGCSPQDGQLFEVHPPGMGAPELTWSYPCVPDKFWVYLFQASDLLGWKGGGSLASAEIAPEPGASGLTFSWSPNVTIPFESSGLPFIYSLKAYESGVWSDWGNIVFWTGQLCVDDPDTYVYYVPPGTEIRPWPMWPLGPGPYVTEEQSTDGWPGDTSPGFSWSYPFPSYGNQRYCLMKFEGQVSEDPTFQTNVLPLIVSPPWNRHGAYIGMGPVEWCHTYYWRVRAYTDGGKGLWSLYEPGYEQDFRIVPPGGESACEIHASIEAVATKNAACRIGPSKAYAIASYVAAGERHPVEGRNAAGTWVKVKLQDLKCYISRELVTLEQQGTPFPGGADVGDLISTLPILPDPPLPTEVPTEGSPRPACSRALPEQACKDAGGRWTSTEGCICP